MLTRRFHRMTAICKLFSHVNQPGLPAVIPDKAVTLQKNRSLILWSNASICSTARSYTSLANTSVACTNPSSDSQSVTRISRVARNEAQDALFDYLHCTRGLSPPDAEHISKNAPTFLQYLMSKVEKEQDKSWSLSRYFRYHPINEFEPFFESLGLKPSEAMVLLPRDLMFLSDDTRMLENFHVLCNFGVPRSKIGKMYKEAMEIFRYDDGVLALKLQVYEDLGFSKPSVIKLVTCCPNLLIGGVNKDFVGVMEKLKILEIGHDWIEGYLHEKNTYYWNRMLGMLNFVSGMGCSNKDLDKLLRKHPDFFFDDSGNKIYVVVALLLKLGLTMSEILGLLLQYPRVLAGKFAKNLWEAVHFLYEIGMGPEEIAKIVQTHPQVLGSCSLVKPKSLLSRLKLGQDDICEMIRKDPNQLRNLASRSKSRRTLIVNEDSMHLPDKTSFLLKLGFVENSEEMMKALKKFRGRGDLLQERFDCLVDAGLDCHDVSNMVREVPTLLNQSRDVIQKKIDYLVNCLGYPIQSIIVFPTYLCYDIERIRLRVSMYNWLKDREAARPMLALSTLLACSEERFIRYLVSLHPEGLQEWERLKQSFSS